MSEIWEWFYYGIKWATLGLALLAGASVVLLVLLLSLLLILALIVGVFKFVETMKRRREYRAERNL